VRVEDDGRDPPDFVAARDHVVQSVLEFGTALRDEGADVPANASIDAIRALVEVGFDDRDRARAALRAVLVKRREDVVTFDRLFPTFWRRFSEWEGDLVGDDDNIQQALDNFGIPSASPEWPDAEQPELVDEDDDPDGASVSVSDTKVTYAEEAEPASEGEDDEQSAAVYSPSGRSEPVSVGPALLGREDDLDAPMRQLTIALAELRGRRWGRAGDERVDVRRALRGSVGTGGTVMSVPTHAKKRSAVRAVLLVDVSQSVLDTIDRGFLLRFIRRACDEWRSVRVFFFDTSVREVTAAFDAPTPEAAVSALQRAEAAWGGGTRIGRAVDAVRRANPEAIDRDTTTIVISDGLEVGELDLLESGVSWLSRRSAALLWCNPLAASPEYAPTCRGMDTALPYVDGLFAFAGPEDVAEIARQLRQRGPRGHVGYEYDGRQRS